MLLRWTSLESYIHGIHTYDPVYSTSVLDAVAALYQ
jgi:hypothetical protein